MASIEVSPEDVEQGVSRLLAEIEQGRIAPAQGPAGPGNGLILPAIALVAAGGAALWWWASPAETVAPAAVTVEPEERPQTVRAASPAAPVPAPPTPLTPPPPAETPRAPQVAPRLERRARGVPAAPALHPDSIDQELALLASAQSALAAGKPLESLQSLEEHRTRFPAGALQEERDAHVILALSAAGRQGAAAERARDFHERHPRSVYAGRIEKALASVQTHVQGEFR
jgi:hypothetical protein